MGVIQRFAVSSMVLGVLAMAGGASAIAFESSGESAAVRPANQSGAPAASDVSSAGSDVDSDVASDVDSDVLADVESDVPADAALLPETGGPDLSYNWFAPQGR